MACSRVELDFRRRPELHPPFLIVTDTTTFKQQCRPLTTEEPHQAEERVARLLVAVAFRLASIFALVSIRGRGDEDLRRRQLTAGIAPSSRIQTAQLSTRYDRASLFDAESVGIVCFTSRGRRGW